MTNDDAPISPALPRTGAVPATGGRVPGSLLRLSDFEPAALKRAVELAREMKRDPGGWLHSLRGAALGCIFEKPSTRTRVSLATAAHRLGMHSMVISRDDMQLVHGETWADTAQVLSSYLDAITLRTYEHTTVEQLAGRSSVPVVNALSDDHHPCQALADLLTLTEHFGTLAGLTVAFVGDGLSNTCNSFLEACASTGMHLTVATPPGHEPAASLLAEARATMAATGGSVTVTADPAEAVRTAQAVYAEVWVPMHKRHERAERAQRFAVYRVDRELLDRAAPGAVVLHCLPAVRGEEITSDVLDGPRSLVWRQAANRLPTAQAVLHTLVTAAQS
ncbi:ornithine carbamoyltransferase [Streptomyces gamaensis]|uniref:Ornithine carbamoyltransferase n=1 Tax=Streptomyces gamaensis TaxID=1763542 RepID=A0ABW0Z3K2_9ACTN